MDNNNNEDTVDQIEVIPHLEAVSSIEYSSDISEDDNDYKVLPLPSSGKTYIFTSETSEDEEQFSNYMINTNLRNITDNLLNLHVGLAELGGSLNDVTILPTDYESYVERTNTLLSTYDTSLLVRLEQAASKTEELTTSVDKFTENLLEVKATFEKLDNGIQILNQNLYFQNKHDLKQLNHLYLPMN